MAQNHKALGNAGEEAVARYIQNRGMQILARNYHSRHGEIDIIAKDGETVVFIEVKTRRSNRFGSPEEAITPAKQKAMVYTALCYAKANELLEAPMRFDVAALQGESRSFSIAYYENAEITWGE